MHVREWMGHAEVETTKRDLHCKRRADGARSTDAAFSTPPCPLLRRFRF